MELYTSAPVAGSRSSQRSGLNLAMSPSCQAPVSLIEEVTTVKVLDASKQNILTLKGIRHHNPWQASRLDEGLDDGALMAVGE